MKVTYIHHSGFLVETRRFYYLFDYEKGELPPMDRKKPIFVLSSHGHGDHYREEVFSLLTRSKMERIQGILSHDIQPPDMQNIQTVFPGQEYQLGDQQTLTTFQSTDLGVAFLLEDEGTLVYHAGDLNDWVWDEESREYNTRMSEDYRRQIRLLAEKLKGRELDIAFVVLDPRQEKDYDRGLCWFLENIPVKKVYPMHYWGKPEIMETFLKDHPEYREKIQKTESK